MTTTINKLSAHPQEGQGTNPLPFSTFAATWLCLDHGMKLG